MKQASKPDRTAKSFERAVAMAGANARKSGEIAVASGHVMAKRLSLGADAMMDPMNADHAEFAKIIPEKAEAFSQAGLSALQSSSDVIGKIAGFAASDLASAMTAMVAMAGCRTPASLLEVQSNFGAAWIERTMTRSIELSSLAARSHGAAMAPIHRAATGNSRRLAR